ncbi:hypothetical protein BGX26_006699 [Mortierella sp. AD094]|nr:hypothetical protein BGX26_006699 [Mortierella sp. AD094]
MGLPRNHLEVTASKETEAYHVCGLQCDINLDSNVYKLLPLFSNIRILRLEKITALGVLLTLRISIQKDDLLSSRQMIAYIVNVCPKLRELKLRDDGLDLSLKGGLCLLSGLRDLERLEIETRDGYPFQAKDMEWIRTDGMGVPFAHLSWLQKQKWRMSLRDIRNCGVARVDKQYFEDKIRQVTRGPDGRLLLGAEDQIIYQVQKAACLENLANLLEELCLKESRYWPLLESVHMSV